MTDHVVPSKFVPSKSSQCGVLYVVATPIGNLEDLSPRALKSLQAVDLIAAEDTRRSGALLSHFGISRPMQSYHDHNEQQRTEALLTRLAGGEDIALISDAGTPLISDPGFSLVREAMKRGIRCVPVPGASSVIAALSVAGLPTDRFVFEGFLPAKPTQRRKALESLRQEPRTLVLLESSHRIQASLQDMADILGGDRYAVIARELTKTYETVRGDELARLCDWMLGDANQTRGEFVVMIAGYAQDHDRQDLEGQRLMGELMRELPIKKAAALAARISGGKKNRLYQWALEQKGQGSENVE